MKFDNFSIVIGGNKCNVKCPFCVAKSTPDFNVNNKSKNWERNLRKACQIAEIDNIKTVLLTGNGEPTLHPEEITNTLKILKDYKIPIIELQTNGVLLKNNKLDNYLQNWFDLGITTIAISTTHYIDKFNNNLICDNSNDKFTLEKLIKKLKELGFSIRIVCTMIRGYIDSLESVLDVITYFENLKIEQLTFRPLVLPKGDNEITCWVKNKLILQEAEDSLKEFFNKYGTKLYKTFYGATIYDYNGQNICFSNCLTNDVNSNKIRQLIYFPDGHVRYDWQYNGAILF